MNAQSLLGDRAWVAEDQATAIQAELLDDPARILRPGSRSTSVASSRASRCIPGRNNRSSRNAGQVPKHIDITRKLNWERARISGHNLGRAGFRGDSAG